MTNWLSPNPFVLNPRQQNALRKYIVVGEVGKLEPPDIAYVMASGPSAAVNIYMRKTPRAKDVLVFDTARRVPTIGRDSAVRR